MSAAHPTGGVAPDERARASGPGVRVLVESRPDTASVNAADALRAGQEWSDTGRVFAGAPIMEASGVESPEGFPVYLVTIPDWHIRHELLGEHLAEACGAPLEALLVLSRHRAASGHPSFTAHPVGNLGAEAIAGGVPGEPTPTHPGILSAALGALDDEAAPQALPHSVGFEATHHGPLTAVPVVFIEIGSDEAHWGNPVAGGVLARAALRAVCSAPACPSAAVMAVGGGHYVPRFTGLVRETGVAMGHMLPSYHWAEGDAAGEGEPGRDLVHRFWKASSLPGGREPDGVYFDRKSFKGGPRARVRDALEGLGVPLLKTADIKDLVRAH